MSVDFTGRFHCHSVVTEVDFVYKFMPQMLSTPVVYSHQQ